MWNFLFIFVFSSIYSFVGYYDMCVQYELLVWHVAILISMPVIVHVDEARRLINSARTEILHAIHGQNVTKGEHNK